MTAIVLDSLVPIFAVMALGYFAGWVRDIDNHHVAELTALVMDFALPAALFTATASTPRSMIEALWPLLTVISVSMLALYALSYWMQRRLFGLDSSAASIQALTIAQPNFGAAGLPLVTAVFDASHSVYVALALASGSILISPLTLSILEANKSMAPDQSGVASAFRTLGRSFIKPIVLSPIFGVVFAFLSIPLPNYIGQAFTLIGQGAGGVAAFLTGLVLSSQRLVLNSNVISGTFLKNALQPLFAAGLIFQLPAPHAAAGATILLAAVPAGFFGVLFGLRYGIKSQEAGSTLIVSSALGAATLAIVLVLVKGG
jgi:malonate transporter and related proteins